MQTNEEKFIAAVEEYLITVLQLKQLVDQRKINPDIPDVPWVHQQIPIHRANAIAAGRACSDANIEIMTAYLERTGFAGDRMAELQDKWDATKIALRKTLPRSEAAPHSTEYPSCPACPGVVTQSKHENLWKAACELSRSGFFSRGQLHGMDCVKQTALKQIGKWLGLMRDKGFIKMNGERRSAEWKVKKVQ